MNKEPTAKQKEILQRALPNGVSYYVKRWNENRGQKLDEKTTGWHEMGDRQRQSPEHHH